MMSYCNLESQFVSCKNEIEACKLVGDYAKMAQAIKKAMAICKRLYEEATDVNKKEIMRSNAVKLNKMFAFCKQKLEEQGKEIPTNDTHHNSKPDQKVKSNNSSVNISNGKNSESDYEKGVLDELGDNIQYEFNGVDVRQFLGNEANDIVMFKDVIGMKDEKILIKREFFADEKDIAFQKKIKKTNKRFLLLYGVPGTGKTYFAKAISCELKARAKEGEQVPFFSIVGPQLKDCKVGASEKNIIAIFEFCKQFKHCVLFIDEFDVLVPDRGKDTGDPTDKSNVAIFLQQMDGFASSKGTLVIGATNCPYNLDSAIISRSDARIEIPLPNEEIILGTLNRKVGDLVAPDVDLKLITKRLYDNHYSNRDVKNYIESLKDELYNAYLYDKENGIEKEMSEYVYTIEMFEKGFSNSPSSIKDCDLAKIKDFKEGKIHG